MQRDGEAPRLATTHTDLDVWKMAFTASMRIFELTKSFPKEETYALTSQIRRSSRSVTINLTEAWRKRRYEAAFVAKLSDAETEAAETQDWLRYAVACKYADIGTGKELHEIYDRILRTLVGMINHASSWTISDHRD
ncbi:MAG TPA: four helix bundle protein [Phycisphaerales bacterium]|nr:four helix bundle protein [Phycisphaerales bacterium]